MTWKPLEAMEFIKDRISKTQDNEEFLIFNEWMIFES